MGVTLLRAAPPDCTEPARWWQSQLQHPQWHSLDLGHRGLGQRSCRGTLCPPCLSCRQKWDDAKQAPSSPGVPDRASRVWAQDSGLSCHLQAPGSELPSHPVGKGPPHAAASCLRAAGDPATAPPAAPWRSPKPGGSNWTLRGPTRARAPHTRSRRRCDLGLGAAQGLSHTLIGEEPGPGPFPPLLSVIDVPEDPRRVLPSVGPQGRGGDCEPLERGSGGQGVPGRVSQGKQAQYRLHSGASIPSRGRHRPRW